MAHSNKRKYNEFNTDASQNASRKRAKPIYPQGRAYQALPQTTDPNVIRGAQYQQRTAPQHYNFKVSNMNVQRAAKNGTKGVHRTVVVGQGRGAGGARFTGQDQRNHYDHQFRRPVSLPKAPQAPQYPPRNPPAPPPKKRSPDFVLPAGPHGGWGMPETTASRQRLGVQQNITDPDPIYETPVAALVLNQLQRNRVTPDMSQLERTKSQLDQQLLRNYEELGRKLEPAREPARLKTWRDYLIQEMQWMASEQGRERKWKRAQLRLLSKAVLRHFNSKRTKAQAKRRRRELAKRKIAAGHAREIKRWWYEAEKLAQIREEYKLHELAQEAADDRLDAFVNQNVKRSTKLAKELRRETPEMDEDGEGTQNAQANRSKLSKMTAAMNKAKPVGVDLGDARGKNVLSKEWLRHGTLREYQQIGLNWLITLYENGTNGILADEMGLGKTIQTIALLAWLASTKEIWGPHLIVVPSSVVVNWESEFKRWSPKFKIVSYHGSAAERKAKRLGWSAPNAFHVCVTSYNCVVKDANALKRIRWHYLVLDEAHNIKNFQSQRWQTLMRFKCKARLLLTGTPLQNNLMELWSLMHFLMPDVFESQQEFKEWFDDPVNGMLDNNKNLARSDIIPRLHAVLRPFLLRRLKADVAKQLPSKTEKIIKCRLSQRQRRLYEDFMAAGTTKKKLQKGTFFSLMNVLMQLRKVCNHPNIFEGRAISSSFQMQRIHYNAPKLVASLAENTFVLHPDSFRSRGLLVTDHERERTNFSWPPSSRPPDWEPPDPGVPLGPESALDEGPNPKRARRRATPSVFAPFLKRCRQDLLKEQAETRKRNARLNILRLSQRPIYGSNVIDLLSEPNISQAPHLVPRRTRRRLQLLALSKDADDEKAPLENGPSSGVISNPAYPTKPLLDAVVLPSQRMAGMRPQIDRFTCLHPPVKAPPIAMSTGVLPKGGSRTFDGFERKQADTLSKHFRRPCEVLHPARVRMQMAFPEKRLIQWDCGKLQMLDQILRREKQGGHRCLIFTQMSKVLDVLEDFLNLHDYRYLRLDGTTKTQKRAELVERFNQQEQYFVFILTTRSGGLGLNLTGADRVIFYDIDWNPAIDLQAQDRAHRIGQTRDVVIYKLVSTNTVEENILRKQEQKRKLNAHVIGDGCFTTDTIQAMDPRELLGIAIEGGEGTAVALKEIESAMELAEDAEDRVALRHARKEQRNTAVEFQEDAPVTEFQEFEQKLRAELHPVDLYALSFFGNDRRPHHSIEEIERKKQSVAVRRTLYELQCSHLSAALASEKKFLDSVAGRWGVALSTRTAGSKIHAKRRLIEPLDTLDTREEEAPCVHHLACDRPRKRRRLAGPPRRAANSRGGGPRWGYTHDCERGAECLAGGGTCRRSSSSRDAVDRYRPLVMGAGPARLRRKRRRRCLERPVAPEAKREPLDKDVTITCTGKIFVKYEPTGPDPYTVYTNAMKRTAAAMPNWDLGGPPPPLASKEDFLKLCAPHVQIALHPPKTDERTNLITDEYIRPDQFQTDKWWPPLFTSKDIDRIKPKGKDLPSVLHRRGVTVLPGRRIKINKRTLPTNAIGRRRTPKIRQQPPQQKAPQHRQAAAVAQQRNHYQPQTAHHRAMRIEPFVAPRFDALEDKILLETAARVGLRFGLVKLYMDNDPRVMERYRSVTDLKARYWMLQQPEPLRPYQTGPRLLAWSSKGLFNVIEKAKHVIYKENQLCEDALKVSIRAHKGSPGGVHPSHARKLQLARRKLGIIPDKQKFTPHTLLKLHIRFKRGRMGINSQGQPAASNQGHRNRHRWTSANANPTSF